MWLRRVWHDLVIKQQQSVIDLLWLEIQFSEKVQETLLWIKMKEKESPLRLNRSYPKPKPDHDAVAPNGYQTFAKAHLSSTPRITENWPKVLC